MKQTSKTSQSNSIACCLEYLELFLQEEIKEKLNKNSEKISPERIIIKAKLEELKQLQMPTIIYNFITKINFKDLNSLINNFPKINVEETFKVSVIKTENTYLDSQETKEKIGELILNTNKTKVDLKEPKTTILLDFNKNELIIGSNPIDLTKRQYHIKTIPQAANPTIAFLVSYCIKPKNNEVIIDPNCRDGQIILEAYNYLKSNKIYASSKYYPHTNATTINSKIIKAKIKISQHDIEFLDTIFEKNSINKIITHLPTKTKKNSEKSIKKLYNQFFSVAEYILKDNGLISILTHSPNNILEKEVEKFFKIKEKIITKKGSTNYQIIVIGKKTTQNL